MTNVEPLGQPHAAHTITLSVGDGGTVPLYCRRVSLYAKGTDARYSITPEPGVATNADHYLGVAERLDFKLPEGWSLNAIGISGAGSLEITELK